MLSGHFQPESCADVCLNGVTVVHNYEDSIGPHLFRAKKSEQKKQLEGYFFHSLP